MPAVDVGNTAVAAAMQDFARQHEAEIHVLQQKHEAQLALIKHVAGL